MKYKITKKITQEVIDEILRIKDEFGLTANAVIMEAENIDSPLHDLFEWDDKKAGRNWRLQQARVIINEIKVVIDSNEFYAFENLTLEVEEGVLKKEYYTVNEILVNETLRKEVVENALREVKYWREKYRQYHELDSIFQAIEEKKYELETA